jgi:hypothetical protein
LKVDDEFRLKATPELKHDGAWRLRRVVSSSSSLMMS